MPKQSLNFIKNYERTTLIMEHGEAAVIVDVSLCLVKLAPVIGIKIDTREHSDHVLVLFFSYVNDFSVYDSIKTGKSSQHGSVHYTTLLEHVIKMRVSYFDTDFVSQIKLTTLLLIHCIVTNNTKLTHLLITYLACLK